MGECLKKGFIFSADSAFSLLVLLAACIIFISHLAGIFHAQELSIKDFSELRKASFLLGSLISDRNETSALHGSAFYSAEKKRVLENVLDYSLLSKAKAGERFGSIFLQEICLSFEDGSREVISKADEGTGCFALERFVLVKYAFAEKKAKIIMRFCHA